MTEDTEPTLSSVAERLRRLEELVFGLIGSTGGRLDSFRDRIEGLRREIADMGARVRDDVTVNLAMAQLAEQAARAATDQSRMLTDLLVALSRQVRRLDEAMESLRQDGGERGE